MPNDATKAVLLDVAALALAGFTLPEGSLRGSGAEECLHITPERVEATNGHVLVMLPVSPIASDDFPVVAGQGGGIGVGGVLIPSAVASAALKALPKKVRIPVLATAHVGGTADGQAVVTTTDLENPRVVRCRKPDSAFPDAAKVMPDAGKGSLLNLSAHYLKAIAEYAIKYGARNPTVTFWVPENGEKSGQVDGATRFEVRLQDGDRKMEGCIMPVRY